MDDREWRRGRRAVITGLGVVAPNGLGVEEFWDGCLSGTSGVARIEAFDTGRFDAKIAGIVRGFAEEAAGHAEAERRGLDRHALFALSAARQAMRSAGLVEGGVDPGALGVCIATAIAGTKYMEEEFLRLTGGGRAPLSPAAARPGLFQGASFHTASSEVARAFGARGPVQTLATGCTAGLDALGQALELIRSGQAEVVIAGASEAPLTPIALAAFDIIGALATDRNDAPETASRPYDRSRAGFVLAEGCGILVLEELAHAEARGAPILAELAGYGSTCNAFHMTDLAPDGEDLARAIASALADAALPAARIDHVNAHGSSTPQNDVNETNALKRALGERARQIPVCSLKSIVGHALAAANAVEAVAAVLTLVHQQVPPTRNYRVKDPSCDLDYVADGPRQTRVDHVLKDASGFSGIHSALVLNRHPRGEERAP